MAVNFNTGNVTLVPKGFYPAKNDLKSGGLSSSSRATLSVTPSLFPSTNSNPGIISPVLTNPFITRPAAFKQAGRDTLAFIKHKNQLNSSPKLKAGLQLLEEDESLKNLFTEKRAELQQA